MSTNVRAVRVLKERVKIKSTDSSANVNQSFLETRATFVSTFTVLRTCIVKAYFIFLYRSLIRMSNHCLVLCIYYVHRNFSYSEAFLCFYLQYMELIIIILNLYGFCFSFWYIAINECDSNPCGEHADCKPINNGYECCCKPGWTGEHCDKSTNS